MSMTPETGSMDLHAFITLLDKTGSQQTAWHPAVRDEARRLLAHSADARAELQAAQTLDQLLDKVVQSFPEHRAPRGLHARILAGLPSRKDSFADRADRLVGWLMAGFWRPVLLSLAPLLLGAWLGSAIPLQEEEVSPALDLSAVLLDEVYTSYD